MAASTPARLPSAFGPSSLSLRDWVAGGAALLTLAALLTAPQPRLAPPKMAEAPLMQVTLESLPEPEPEQKPSEPQPTTPQTAPPMAAVRPPPLPAPKPVKQVARQPVLAPSSSHQVEETQQQTSQAAPSAPSNAPISANAPAQPTPPPSPPATTGKVAETEEERYVAGLRSYLESIKRYPTSREARIEHPTGIATVWFVLDRAGSLVESGIDHTAGSALLDQAALATLRRGEFKAFPAEVWGDAPTHRFTLKLDFTVSE